MPDRASLLATIPLNTHDIPQSLLNIENKNRSNPFPWKGQFSPQFVQALLERYATVNTVVLDPFLGSGTVLHEAGRLKMEALGTEINPAAYLMAQVYRFINVDLETRRTCVERVSAMLRDVLPRSMPMLGAPICVYERGEIISRLCGLQGTVNNTAHKILLEALIVLLDFWKPDLNESRLYSVWKTLARQVLSLPISERPIRIFNCDARHLPISDQSVNLIITSPPYINVQNYHQQFRRSTEAIGWNLLDVARSEIGSNRKNRGNRFLTVIQYCVDMAMALVEMRRVCISSGRIIAVLGRETNVRGTAFYNGDIVARLAKQCAGLEIEMRQERVFYNRFGLRVYEDILHFARTDQDDYNVEEKARCVAHQALLESLLEAPCESKEDIQAALLKATSVHPSPMYGTLNLRNNIEGSS
ncbi:MAG: DNA methyltransferase [Armatimonadota bacterium]|nr:DNA methyltransferase [Armatimonadota bacterium]